MVSGTFSSPGSCNAITFPKISSGKALKEEDDGSAPELHDRQEEIRKGELIPTDLSYIMFKYL